MLALAPILLAMLIVAAGTWRYCYDQYAAWRASVDRLNTQGAHVRANQSDIRELWVDARLRQPGFYLDGRAHDLYEWTEQELRVLDGEDIGLLLPVQEELIRDLSGANIQTAVGEPVVE